MDTLILKGLPVAKHIKANLSSKIEILLKNNGSNIIKAPQPGTEGSIVNSKSIKDEK